MDTCCAHGVFVVPWNLWKAKRQRWSQLRGTQQQSEWKVSKLLYKPSWCWKSLNLSMLKTAFFLHPVMSTNKGGKKTANSHSDEILPPYCTLKPRLANNWMPNMCQVASNLMLSSRNNLQVHQSEGTSKCEPSSQATKSTMFLPSSQFQLEN